MYRNDIIYIRNSSFENHLNRKCKSINKIRSLILILKMLINQHQPRLQGMLLINLWFAVEGVYWQI